MGSGIGNTTWRAILMANIRTKTNRKIPRRRTSCASESGTGSLLLLSLLCSASLAVLLKVAPLPSSWSTLRFWVLTRLYPSAVVASTPSPLAFRVQGYYSDPTSNEWWTKKDTVCWHLQYLGWWCCQAPTLRSNWRPASGPLHLSCQFFFEPRNSDNHVSLC